MFNEVWPHTQPQSRETGQAGGGAARPPAEGAGDDSGKRRASGVRNGHRPPRGHGGRDLMELAGSVTALVPPQGK